MSSVSKEVKHVRNGQGLRVGNMRIAPQLLVLLAALAFIAALWSYMSLNTAKHETLDQHVYRIASQLKCPICQSESVADSTSSLAQEMRGVIRQKIQAGESDQQIIQEFIDSYGTQIVWSPPWWGFSVLAWLVPIVLLLSGIGFVAMTLQSWRAAPVGSPPVGSPVKTASASISHEGDEESESSKESLNDDELARYRAQLERELVEDDILFQRKRIGEGESR